MNENETEYELGEHPGEFICDFCGKGWDLLWSVNDGLWAVCSKCMDEHYAQVHGEEE